MPRVLRILVWILIAGTAIAIINGDAFGVTVGAVSLLVSALAGGYLASKERPRRQHRQDR